MCDGESQRDYIANNFLPKFKDAIVPSFGSINGLRDGIFDTGFAKRISQAGSEIFQVCYIGRKCKDKGLAVLEDISKIPEFQLSNIKFVLAGPVEDDYHEEYSVLKRKLTAFTGKFKFIDEFVNPVDLLKNAHCLFLPSLREGFGTVVIEAQAFGCPVVVSDIYGLKDSFKDKLTGYSCSHSSDEYFAAIKSLSKPDIYNEFSINARSFASNFAPNNFKKSLLQAYKDVNLL